MKRVVMSSMTEVFRDGLAYHPLQRDWLQSHGFHIGDLHNHCAISYGHGFHRAFEVNGDAAWATPIWIES